MAMVPSQPSGVLLHFKFLQDFHARALDAVMRGVHYDGSREYRRYLAALEAEPGFTLHGPRSLAYAGPGQLVELGLMRDTRGWAAARGEAAAAGLLREAGNSSTSSSLAHTAPCPDGERGRRRHAAVPVAIRGTVSIIRRFRHRTFPP
jgi:hypothetical protein